MDSQNNKIKLGWGNPKLFIEYWNQISIAVKSTSQDFEYTYGGTTILKEYIKLIHQLQNNCETKGKYIVVGNGATQILNGLINILNKPVTATAPHFPKFPEFAALSKLPFIDSPESVRITTIPNNPDNSVSQFSKEDILDCCYNWSTYGVPLKVDAPIAVFNLSKCTGHSNIRIGWAVLENEELAHKLEKYVEHNSGGISITSQNQAVQILNHLFKTNGKMFEYSKSKLEERWERLLKLNLPFKVLNTSGQFAWCQGEPHEQMDVLMGHSFGVTDDFFRVNMSCSNADFEELISLYE